MIRTRSRVAAAAALLLGAACSTQAAGTAAGTSIQNTAEVSYTVGGSSVTTSSNQSVVTVAEILDAVVTTATPSVSVSPGATLQDLVFTLTNTGNGSEAFSLVALSSGLTGDDFDPTLSTPAIYFDTDNSGDFSPGDVAYVPGGNDPVLAADASVRVIVLNDIPAGALDGTTGRSQLTASARTGTGTAGTTFAGQGDGGVDAVAGTTGADAQIFGAYRVEALAVTAVKSQVVVDQFGGSRPIPGARINYQIVINANGTGTAAAAVFSDLVPTNTTYVAGSLELNNVALSDGSDADAGALSATPAPRVSVTLGNLTQASGPQTIEFAVTIN